MKLKVFLSLVFIFVFTTCYFAAPPPPPSGGPGCWPPPCIPIDGGISILIIAGAVYGGKKLYNKSKSDKYTL